MQSKDADWLLEALRAVANQRRLEILQWLSDPVAHFPPQEHGDLVEHGACNVHITERLAISQPAASRHLKCLVDAELVCATSRKGWTYFRRNEPALDRLAELLGNL